MSIRYLLLAILTLSLSGCSFLSDDDKHEEVMASLVAMSSQAAHLEKLWSRGVGDLGDDSLALIFTPAIDGDAIYTASAKGRVMSINKMSGNVKWSQNLNKPLTSAVGAGYGLVIVADHDGGIHAINSSDGSLRWQAQASSEVLAAPATDGNVVVIQAVNSRVQAFDAKSGAALWDYSASQSVLSLRGNAAPVMRGEIVYVAFDNGKAAALDAKTGLLQWEQRFLVPDGRSEFERVIDVQADPVVVGSSVIVGAYQGVVVSMDRAQGRPHWEQKASIVRSMAEDGAKLFFVESNDTVRSLEIESGKEAWKSELFTARKLSAPAVISGYVAVADKEGYVHLLDQSDGIYSGRVSVGGDGVRANLVSDSGILFVVTNSGQLKAFSIRK